MQRLLAIRITSWHLKLLYIVGAWLVGWPVAALFRAVNTPSLLASVINTLIFLATIMLGARLFRGQGEPVAPPRPWWKMTARPLLSRVLGGISTFFVASTLVTLLAAAFGVEKAVQSLERSTVAEMIVSGVFAAVLAFLYLNSAVRLRKLPAPTKKLRFAPKIRLK